MQVLSAPAPMIFESTHYGSPGHSKWRSSLGQHLSAFIQCVSGTASLSLLGLSPESERDWIVVGNEGNSVIAIQHHESHGIYSTKENMVDNPFFSCVWIVGDRSKSIICNDFI